MDFENSKTLQTHKTMLAGYSKDKLEGKQKQII